MKYFNYIFFILLSFISGIGHLNAEQKTDLDCLVNPEMYIDISSAVDGVLETVLVKKSDVVKSGQKLAKLESSIETAKVKLAAQEAAIKNKIHAKKVAYEFAKRRKIRVDELYKKNAISFQDHDEAVTQVEIARTDLKQAQLDRKKAQLEYDLAIARLKQKTITSPIDGIVVEKYLMPGESVNDRPILQLAKVNPLLVEVVAPAELFGLIRKEMQVEIRPETPLNSTYQATVNIVDRIIDAASGSFSVRLALPNPDDKLVGGTKCIARFNITAPTSIAQTTPDVNDVSFADEVDALTTP